MTHRQCKLLLIHSMTCVRTCRKSGFCLCLYRSSESAQYLHYIEQYFSRLLPLLRPLTNENGGPIIAFQIENEFGSIGVSTESDSVNVLSVRLVFHMMSNLCTHRTPSVGACCSSNRLPCCQRRDMVVCCVACAVIWLCCVASAVIWLCCVASAVIWLCCVASAVILL